LKLGWDLVKSLSLGFSKHFQDGARFYTECPYKAFSRWGIYQRLITQIIRGSALLSYFIQGKDFTFLIPIFIYVSCVNIYLCFLCQYFLCLFCFYLFIFLVSIFFMFLVSIFLCFFCLYLFVLLVSLFFMFLLPLFFMFLVSILFIFLVSLFV
jgi:hypothetical protein